MTPTEQDKELRAELAKLEVYTTVKSEKHPLYHKDIDKIMQLINADRKQVALEARIAEMKLHRHEWELFGDRPPYEGESVSLPILLAYHDDRIAELKAQQEEV